MKYLSFAIHLEIEVHPSPEEACSDSAQQLNQRQFSAMMCSVRETLAFREQLRNGGK